jgi:hypothetical protein
MWQGRTDPGGSEIQSENHSLPSGANGLLTLGLGQAPTTHGRDRSDSHTHQTLLCEALSLTSC